MASPDEHVIVKTPEQMAREAAAQEQQVAILRAAVERLDQLIVEAKADKTQMVAQTQRLEDRLAQVVDSVDSVKRSVRKAS